MPTSEGGYEMPQDVYDQWSSGLSLEGMNLKPRMLVTNSQQLEALTVDVAELRQTLNEIKALLWQLVLKADGINVTIQPTDHAETGGIISANGITLAEQTWTTKP